MLKQVYLERLPPSNQDNRGSNVTLSYTKRPLLLKFPCSLRLKYLTHILARGISLVANGLEVMFTLSYIASLVRVSRLRLLSWKTPFLFVSESLLLRIIRVSVPPYRIRGQVAILECDYELDNDGLYSVKWYRDNEEFYRYMPKFDPPKHAYKLDGVKVDVSILFLHT